MPANPNQNCPQNRLLEGQGEVRCRCGALMFRACGPVCLEMKCRRCGLLWRIATTGVCQ